MNMCVSVSEFKNRFTDQTTPNSDFFWKEMVRKERKMSENLSDGIIKLLRYTNFA